jgi:hypothetical protein
MRPRTYPCEPPEKTENDDDDEDDDDDDKVYLLTVGSQPTRTIAISN